MLLLLFFSVTFSFYVLAYIDNPLERVCLKFESCIVTLPSFYCSRGPIGFLYETFLCAKFHHMIFFGLIQWP